MTLHHPIEARRSAMDLFESFLESTSSVGVFRHLIELSTTDTVVLFLLSKPAFILVAAIVVFHSKWRALREERQVAAEAGH